jgi:hypothetical protein
MNFVEKIIQKIIGEKLEKSIKGNWKTTLAALVAALILILTEIQDLIDSNPDTVFEWNKFWTLGIIVIVGLFAKDGDKTSEDVGIK